MSKPAEFFDRRAVLAHCKALRKLLEWQCSENESQYHLPGSTPPVDFLLQPCANTMHLPVDLAYELLPLMLLTPGQQASVGQLVGRAEEVHRLQELGLREGAPIEMLQTGSPCIVRLGGNKLCFRGDEATHVLVRLGASA